MKDMIPVFREGSLAPLDREYLANLRRVTSWRLPARTVMYAPPRKKAESGLDGAHE